MQRRRVHYATATRSAGQTGVIDAPIDESSGVNVHGLRAGFMVEPQDADANAHGTWSLWCLPRESTAIPATSIAALELEADNNVLWACGIWGASNQSPYTKDDIAPKTSRNCPQGSRITLVVTVEGISAGVARLDLYSCYFTKSL